jgi:ribonucleoside-diphosphate reductase alpha chain
MDKSFILRKYGQYNTPHVTATQWKQLATDIKETKLLRNATTSALPPTGRSATIIGASQSLEPIFSFYNPTDGIHPLLHEYLARNSLAESKSLLEEIKKTGTVPESFVSKAHPFITATQLEPSAHIKMIIVAQKAIDESISKTVNLPEETTPEQIASIYRQAYAAGLKGISIYRNNSRFYQPKKLSEAPREDKK